MIATIQTGFYLSIIQLFFKRLINKLVYHASEGARHILVWLHPTILLTGYSAYSLQFHVIIYSNEISSGQRTCQRRPPTSGA